MYYCNFVNPPPSSKGEGPFPESIVDDRDAEPISSLVARMLRGELPPRDRELIFDTEDENADPDDFPSTVFDPTDFVPMDDQSIHDQPKDEKPKDEKPVDPPVDEKENKE